MANVQTQHSFTHSAFHLSTDYDLLWDLIRAGHRIPGWLINTQWSEQIGGLVWDLVEIKYRADDQRYMIGTRGIGYDGVVHTCEGFKAICAHYSLHYVLPHVGGLPVTIPFHV